MQRVLLMGIALILVLITSAAVPGCSADLDSLDSHARMLALLAEIRDEADLENEYVGEGYLRELEGDLAEIEIENSLSELLHLRMGRELLKLGRTDAAIDELMLLVDFAAFNYQVLKRRYF